MMDFDWDAHDLLALYRIVLWLALAFMQWRVARQLYPTQRAVLTINSAVFALMGLSALVNAMMTARAADSWLAYVVTPIMSGAVVSGFAVWRSKRLK